MNEAVWLPGLVVLAAGLGIGLTLVLRMRGAARVSEPSDDSPDRQLRLRDLEGRRDDLYRRLRAADEDGLSESERIALEEAAARTLREIDRAGGLTLKDRQQRRQPHRQAVESPTPAGLAAGRPAAASRERADRRPLLVGFATGVALTLVLAFLVYWAVRDAKPEQQPAAPQSLAADAREAHEGQVPLTPEMASRIASLEARLTADPEDWLAKKELGLSMLELGRFMDAFGQAGDILRRFPDDPDGLFIMGVVRLTMGQSETALDLMDRVLAQYPDHRQALLYRGLALYQLGNHSQAIDTWEVGLEMAGGSDAGFEEVLAMAIAGGDPGQQTVDATSGLGASRPPEAPAGNGFQIDLVLAPGLVPDPQATLFVYLRPTAGGPPVAVKRIATPSFPLRVTLDATDSMMGADLPASGTVVARLDRDGSVGTTDEMDLAAEAVAQQGALARLVLAR